MTRQAGAGGLLCYLSARFFSVEQTGVMIVKSTEIDVRGRGSYAPGSPNDEFAIIKERSAMGDEPEVSLSDLQPLISRVTERPDAMFPLYDVWGLLARGQWEAIDAICGEEMCYLITSQASRARTPVRAQSLQILEKTLHGYGQKCLALDVGVSCSTIASTAKQALASFGLECVPSRTPLALVLVAQASQDYERKHVAPVSAFLRDGRPHYVIALSRPDCHLKALLSPAEVAVLKARLEGQSHRRIARIRHTSERTIANQLNSAGRRLGVTGRLETIGHLSQRAAANA